MRKQFQPKFKFQALAALAAGTTREILGHGSSQLRLYQLLYFRSCNENGDVLGSKKKTTAVPSAKSEEAGRCTMKGSRRKKGGWIGTFQFLPSP